jgi:flagellar biogenesis protein FliO
MSGGNYVWAFVRMVVYLALVCLVMYAVVRWLLPRLHRWRYPGRGDMMLIDQIPLGGAKSICLIKAVGRYYLVGIGGESIHLISELDPGEVEARYPPKGTGSGLKMPWGEKKA